jgi:hypothetical protein
MTLNNVPSPVRPTDADALLAVLSAQATKAERNVNDPNAWIYVGSGSPAPDFQNGFFNVLGSRVPLRYRFLRPYDPDTTQNAVQLQGSIAGGSAGATIFTLLSPLYAPDGTPNWQTFTMDYDTHLTCCDDSGNLVIVTVQGATGHVIFGFV